MKNIITHWKTYEKEYASKDWEGEQDDRVH